MKKKLAKKIESMRRWLSCFAQSFIVIPQPIKALERDYDFCSNCSATKNNPFQELLKMLREPVIALKSREGTTNGTITDFDGRDLR